MLNPVALEGSGYSPRTRRDLPEGLAQSLVERAGGNQKPHRPVGLILTTGSVVVVVCGVVAAGRGPFMVLAAAVVVAFQEADAAGEVLQPVRTMLTVEESQRFLGVMPAVTHQAMGAKLVCFYPKNAVTGLPTHMATIVLIEPQTGTPLACLDGRLITEMRTAAVSAAVTRHVASESARVLTLIGSGVQAHAHLEALRHVRPFEEVRVWSRTAEHAQAFAAANGLDEEKTELPGYKPFVESLLADFQAGRKPCASLEDCVAAADLVDRIYVAAEG